MLNGHPTLMKQVRRSGVKYGTSVPPGADGPSGSTLGVADWVMAFKKNGRREEAGLFLDFVFGEKNHYRFADRYDLLPVTTSANERMHQGKEHKPMWRFQDELATAEFYPVGKVSWAKVSEDIKRSIGKAVAPGTDPVDVLLQIRGDGYVSAEKQAEILRVAKRLHYTPNSVARSLRMQQTRTIGVVTDAIATNAFGGEYMVERKPELEKWGAYGKALRGRTASDILASYYGGLQPESHPEPGVIRVRVASGLTSLRLLPSSSGARLDGEPIGRERLAIEGGETLSVSVGP